MRPLILSLVVGFLIAAASIGAITRAAMKKNDGVDRGWDPRPVLVMTRDLPEGEVLTAEAVNEGMLPEQFVGASVIDVADRSLVIGQRPATQLQKGDVLVWGVFALPVGGPLTVECTKRVRDAVGQAGERAAREAVDQFARRLGPPMPVDSLPPRPGAGEVLEVIVAREDIPAGTRLSREQLGTRRLPPGASTASHVSARYLEAAAQARTTVPLLKGDPLMWQLLDDDAVPRGVASCVNEVVRAHTEERKRAAAVEAAAFVRSREAP